MTATTSIVICDCCPGAHEWPACPDCGSEDHLQWGPEGSRWEDCWDCRCGASGVAADLETEEGDDDEA
jgi:hypothetical protein